MNLSDFARTSSQLQTTSSSQVSKPQQQVLGLVENELRLTPPLRPISRWIRLLGALGNNPGLAHFEVLKQAKQSCDDYAVKLQTYQVKNNTIRSGFVQALREKHGAELTDLCRPPPLNGKALSARAVEQTLANIERCSQKIQAENTKNIKSFIHTFLTTSPKDSEKKWLNLDPKSKQFIAQQVLQNCKTLDHFSKKIIPISDSDNAIKAAFKALQAIKNSPTLSEIQKDMLLDIGQKTPLDRLQIKQYELLSVALKTPSGSESKSAPRLSNAALNTLETALSAIQENAKKQQTASDISIPDQATGALLEQLVSVAVAGLDSSQASQALETLNSSPPEASNTQWASAKLNTEWRKKLGSVLTQSLQTQIVSAAQPSPTRSSTSEISSTDFRSRTGETKASAAKVDLTNMTTQEGELDERGVTKRAANESQVSVAFSANKVFSASKEEILKYIKDDDRMGDGLSRTMHKDLTRAQLIVNGVHINGDSETQEIVKTNFESALEKAGASKETLNAVSLCMNQRGINRFTEACNWAAFEGLVVTTQASVEHKTWQQDDGSWLVRSSYNYQPMIISKSSSESMIEEGRSGLYALTYRITPQAPGTPAQIELEGYSAAFDF